MGKKDTIKPAETGTAAYHDGPPEIEFAGRRWIIDQDQPMIRAEFDALQARADVALFAFTFTELPEEI